MSGGLYGGKVPKGTRRVDAGRPRKSRRPIAGGTGKPPKTCVCMVMAFAGGVGWLVYDAVAAVLPYNPWDRW